MLTAGERRALRQRAHHLKPVVQIGQRGVTPGVLDEIDRALFDHELIKIRFRGMPRDARSGAIDGIASGTAADVVHVIGGTAVLYRENLDAEDGQR